MKENTRRPAGAKAPARSQNSRKGVAGQAAPAVPAARAVTPGDADPAVVAAVGADSSSRAAAGVPAFSGVLATVEGFEARKGAALAAVAFMTLPEDSTNPLAAVVPGERAPLPVQSGVATESFDASLITPESIIAGMLRVLAWDGGNRHAGYYRRFIAAVRPGLHAELTDAGAQKVADREWDVAEEIFLALHGLDPSSPEPVLDLAFLHEAKADLLSSESREEESESESDRAHRLYGILLAAEPPYAPAFYHAGMFYLKRRNFERTISLMKTFVSLGGDDKRVEKATRILGKLEASGYLDTLFKEAYDFIRMGEDEKGLEKAREFTARHPKVWNGWFLEGWACRHLGRWEEGRRAFREAIALGAEESDAYNELSICQAELGDLQGARRSLERALRSDPENVKIIVNIGALAFRQGRKEEAAGFFRTALDLDPADKPAADWLERIGLERS